MASKQALEFKSKKQVDEIRAFVDGELQTLKPEVISHAQLSKLSLDDLVERMESVHNQSLLEIWMICLAIREKFKSDPEMGRFIKTIAETNPHHPLCVVRQQTRTNYINAARFCVKHRITNLKTIGMCPTALCNLAAPKYRHVADKIYRELKVEQRNYSVAHVNMLIAKELSFDAEHENKVGLIEKMPYEHPFALTKQDEKLHEIGIITEASGEPEQETEEAHDYIEGAFSRTDDKAPESPQVGYDHVFIKHSIKQNQYDAEQVWPQVDRRAQSKDSHMIELSDISSDDLILELASRTEPKSAKERQDEIMLFVERFDASFSELGEDFEALKKRVRKLVA